MAAGMIFGDAFAVFVLHPNADRIGQSLLAATQAVAAGDADAVGSDFAHIGYLLENRGTKVDTHTHATDFGYLALLLAVAQPWVAFDERRRRQLARLFLLGAVMLPVGVFCIHYVGLAYSPFSAIGWASVVADLGGFFVLLALAGEAVGIVRGWRSAAAPAEPADRSWSARVLLCGGTLLILAGFAYGAWYAGIDLYRIEAQDHALLDSMASSAAAGHSAAAASLVNDYGALQAEKAVKIAAHSHIIEFGLLALLLAFVQPYVFLSETWRRRWVVTLLAGSVILPVFVLMEARWGLASGGIADFGGLLVIVALLGMLAGVVRYTGSLDTGSEPAP